MWMKLNFGSKHWREKWMNMWTMDECTDAQRLKTKQVLWFFFSLFYGRANKDDNRSILWWLALVWMTFEFQQEIIWPQLTSIISQFCSLLIESLNAKVLTNTDKISNFDIDKSAKYLYVYRFQSSDMLIQKLMQRIRNIRWMTLWQPSSAMLCIFVACVGVGDRTREANRVWDRNMYKLQFHFMLTAQHTRMLFIFFFGIWIRLIGSLKTQ